MTPKGGGIFGPQPLLDLLIQRVIHFLFSPNSQDFADNLIYLPLIHRVLIASAGPIPLLTKALQLSVFLFHIFIHGISALLDSRVCKSFPYGTLKINGVFTFVRVASFSFVKAIRDKNILQCNASLNSE